MSWTDAQDRWLLAAKADGAPWSEMQKHFGKSIGAIRDRHAKLTQGKYRDRSIASAGDGWNPQQVRHNSLAFAIDGARFFGVSL